MKRAVYCLCTHAKSRHRQQWGEPHSGPCMDCERCEKFRDRETVHPATDQDWIDFRDGRIG